MMEPTIQRENNADENGHHTNSSSNSSNVRYRDGRKVSPRHRQRGDRERRHEEYRPQQYESSSYLASFCRSCCTFQHFCYVVQLVQCGLICGLIYWVSKEYPKLQALDHLDDLQKQIDQDRADIEALQEEVHTKQEGQLETIEESLKQEQRNSFLSFAGIFTLLTCLISMFHMTTHVHKLCQPKIQRKIIAILWMSPIYSVTSFLSLIFPPIEGWMAIVKDFYESYCIFVFLSFLIAVLGEGSRDKAVEVLAKHADHLDNPTRCLGCFYEPPPSTSDHAKANAVMTQCQIYCLQFTIIRPLTTIIRVFVFGHKNEATEDEEEIIDDEFYDNSEDYGDTEDSSSNSNIENYSSTNNTSDWNGDGSSGTEIGEAPQSSNTQSGNFTDTATSANDGSTGSGGTRRLQYLQNKRRRRKRSLQLEHSEEEKGDTPPTIGSSLDNNDENSDPFAEFPSMVPVFAPSMAEAGFPPTFPSDPVELPPTFAPNDVDAPTLLSPIADVGFENDAIPTFDYNNNNNTGFDGMFTSNTTQNFSPTFTPTMPPSLLANDTSFVSDELVDQTKAYFRSPGFALAMVVNVSIFFAFSGLLKLYHAVREDLLWCRPFPKFLTIKAVVFLTFWQGLAILIYLILAGVDDASAQAHRYQNMLICVEMLLVAISQWCVFPAVEWEANYEPRNMQTPGLGIKDFVSDVGQIVKNRKSRKGRRRKKRTPTSGKSGLYHMPGFASIVSSQFDGFGGPSRADNSSFDEEDFENSSMDRSYDSSSTYERDGADNRTRTLSDDAGIINENGASTYVLPPSAPPANRDRLQSDDTGGYSIEDEVLDDNDLELL